MIRAAKAEEASEISSMTIRSKAVWGYPAEWMAVFREELTVDGQTLLAFDTHVAERNGTIIGCYALAPRSETEVELEYMFVDPQFLRQGIGSQLLVHAIERSRTRGFRTMKIIADPHASGFYERHGALVVDEHQSSIAGRSIPILALAL